MLYLKKLDTDQNPPQFTAFDNSTNAHPKSARNVLLQRLKPWLVAILIAGGGGVATWSVLDTAPSAPQTQASAASPPRPVEVTQLEAGAGIQTLELIGEVVAANQATVRAQTSGIVKQVLVDVGDPIQSGQPFLVLDTVDQGLALARAKATLVSARSELERLERGTRVEILAQRRAELQATQAREQEALDNLQNLQALVPDLLAQRHAELEAAKAMELEAQDRFQRTQQLTIEGALSRRALVEAQANSRAATSERLRATAAVTAQRTENQQNLAQARSLLDAAKSNRLRTAALLAEATAGPRQEDIAAQRGVVQAAESAVAQAELELSRATIKAELSGYISDRPVNVGDYIERNDAVLNVVSRERLDIFLEIPETSSGRVNPGETVQLTASALPTWKGSATISGVVPTANTASRRQQVRVRLENPPTGLLPGMAITGYLKVPAPNAQFVISRDALTRRLNEWVVYTVNSNNEAQEIAVELVADMGQTVAISSPELILGQTIVINGGDGLRNGAAIKVFEQETVSVADRAPQS